MHPVGVRARATAALLVGERPAAVARDLGVPAGTVRSWKRRIKTGGVATLKKGDAGPLILAYLEASLGSLIAQARRLSDPEALRETPAGELAALFGALFDRTMRALELAPVAVGPGGRDPPPRE